MAQAPTSTKVKKKNGPLLALLLGPALFFLLAFVVYPIGYSFVRSLQSRRGDEFVGIDNYVKIFTDPQTFTALKNNLIWVLVAPAVCTIIGLVFAVLMEKIKWSTAFKLIIFMPMAISMLAAGIIFRTVFQQNPNVGVANAMVISVKEVFSDGSQYPEARVRTGEEFPDFAQEGKGTEITSTREFAPGEVVYIPMVGIKPEYVEGAQVAEEAGQIEGVSGTVWLDFVKGGGGENGAIDADKPGLAGITLIGTTASGEELEATTSDTGVFTFETTEPITITVPANNFAGGPSGINWLGPKLITPVIILSYVWIWAGFAMVMIASGLAAVDRSLMEAARTDGANEWQVFRHITVPQLTPVLTVVLVTLMINVLKIFDLVYVIPTGDSKNAADVLATRMWTVSFGGGNDQGLGSALSILLLVLVLPFMIMNIRNFKKGGQS